MSSCSKLYPKSKPRQLHFFVKDDQRIGHHMKYMSDMVDHYFVTATDNYCMTREGHQKSLISFPSEFGATKDDWEEKGIQAC
jgi:hypothetical protein